MKDFFKQLIAKLVSYFLFFVLMFFIFACLITGEFPPKLDSIRTHYQNLVELKKSSMALMKVASARMKAAESVSEGNEAQMIPGNEPGSSAAKLETSKTRLIKENDFAQDIGEIRREQIRLKAQLDLIIQQNNEMIKLLVEIKKH